ncbi:hypothetical protein KLVA111896_24655 [Klebsiella variicola]|nr:hypothetical protein SB5610_04896 [Klebsiella variicola]
MIKLCIEVSTLIMLHNKMRTALVLFGGFPSKLSIL